MNKEYKHGNRNKYLLRYHLILVCKYRKHLLSANNISSDMKTLAKTIYNKHNVRIHYMEVDKDHLHMMIETTPIINLSDYVRTLKSYTTFHIWKKYSSYLSKCFWKEKTLDIIQHCCIIISRGNTYDNFRVTSKNRTFTKSICQTFPS